MKHKEWWGDIYRERIKSAWQAAPRIIIWYIAVSLLIITFDAFVYPRGAQHDAWLHLRILNNIYKFSFTETYNGVLYYILVALLSAPLILLYKIGTILGQFDGSNWSRISVFSSGIVLWLVFFFGLSRLYIEIGFSRSTAYLCAAATAVLPPIMRSYIMIRPENLILSLSPYLFISTFKLLEEPDSKRRLAVFCGVAGLIASQKVTGLAFVLWALAAILMTQWSAVKNIQFSEYIRIFPLFLISFLFFGLLNYIATGGLMFNHHANLRPEYASHTPTLLNILGINLISVWESPLRGQFPISLLNIFSVDLFGDYWGFGINHSKLQISSDFKIMRARTSLFLTGFFVVTFFAGLAYAIMRKHEHLAKSAIVLSQTLLVGLLVLVFASLKYWHPAKGDTYKWEYICMFMIFAYMPLALLIETKRMWRTTGYLFVVSGMIQSTIFLV